MFDLQLALKPFKDPRILPKAGMIFGVYAISSLLQYLINFAPVFSGFIPAGIDSEMLSTISSIFSFIGAILVSLMLFPATLYILGYTYKAADRIRTGSDEVLPEHDDFGEGIKLGGIAIGFSFILTLPFIVLISVLLFLLVSILDPNVAFVGGGMGFGVIAAIVVFVFLAAFFLAFTDIFIVPIYMYRYLTTRDFVTSFSFGPFLEVLRVSWLDWLVVFFISAVFGVSVFVLQFVLCCLGPFLTPVVDTVTVLVTAGLTGAVYNKIDGVMGGDVVSVPETVPLTTSGSNSAG